MLYGPFQMDLTLKILGSPIDHSTARVATDAATEGKNLDKSTVASSKFVEIKLAVISPANLSGSCELAQQLVMCTACSLRDDVV